VVEGVVAPETWRTPPPRYCMLTLGVPVPDRGSDCCSAAAGLVYPGRCCFAEQKSFVWGLIASMYLRKYRQADRGAHLPLFAAILRVPFSVVAAPIIIVIAAQSAPTPV
jgi:putative tricarboxylic transport membrane protein